MRPALICASLLIMTALFLPVGVARAADTMQIEAQLIWGTNEAKTDSKLKPVGPKLSDKLKHSLPFKWDHYYECNRMTFPVKLNQEISKTMSKRCEIGITYIGESQIRFKLFGHGQLVSDLTQALPKGELLITGGEAENSTAWFVVLRQAD